jgi:hypothetical protein
MGPMTIFDKSALQALSMDESVWFDAFFGVNVVPVFYIETLADLEKDMAEGKNAEDLVEMLAEKTPSNAYPNVYHGTLIAAELAGHPIAMDGRPVISAGEIMKGEDGSVGLHVEEFPEHTALLRWQEHDFLTVERALAKEWRVDLAGHDPDRVLGMVRNILQAERKLSNLEQVKTFIDEFCSSSDSQVLALALEVLGIDDDHRRLGRQRWEAARKPRFDKFFPYVCHVFKVDLLFYLGIERGFISGERASNKADMAYLYYLPFAAVFTSNDKLHQRTVPLFLSEGQSYLSATELKGSLSELDAYYSALPNAVKELGVLAFASYPPPDMDNSVTQLWDQHMRPDWREIAKKREAELGKPRDESSDATTLDDIKERLAKVEPVSDVAEPDGGADYFVISRRVPARKGKWRMVSEEIEHSDSEA